jgi:predicted alpha/beta-fold hydrolase
MIRAATTNWEFRRHPLLPNGHMQTFAGVYLPRIENPYQATQYKIPLADGDHLVVHEDLPADWTARHPNVLLIHGLAGSYRSTYMCRITDRLLKANYGVFRLDMRGCGAGEGLARYSTHCDRWEDAAAALEFIARRHPQSATSLVGYSMGGAIGLNLLAQTGSTRIGNLERTLAICPPIDLFDIERRFDKPLGRAYDRFFVRMLWQQIVNRWHQFPELAPKKIPRRRPRRLRQIDELVTAPLGGYSEVDNYYQTAAPGPKLAFIKQPVTILAAADDPIVPSEPLVAYPCSPDVETVVTPSGGHLGFIARRTADPDRRWLDWRILDWLQHG